MLDWAVSGTNPLNTFTDVQTQQTTDSQMSPQKLKQILHWDKKVNYA